MIKINRNLIKNKIFISKKLIIYNDKSNASNLRNNFLLFYLIAKYLV